MKKIISILLIALPVASLYAQDDSNWKSQELVSGIYMLASDRGFAGGNLGLLTGDDGVVLGELVEPSWLRRAGRGGQGRGGP